jgi:IS30 family transposase
MAMKELFPKGTDFTKVTPRDAAGAELLLNERPRKRLNNRTSSENVVSAMSRD